MFNEDGLIFALLCGQEFLNARLPEGVNNLFPESGVQKAPPWMKVNEFGAPELAALNLKQP